MKLVKIWEEDRLELFDLDKDIGEARDLSGDMTKKTEELHALLLDYLAAVNADIKPRKKRKSNSNKDKIGTIRYE